MSSQASAVRSRESRYKYVRALLLSWERRDSDGPHIQEQLTNMYSHLGTLKNVFERFYYFDVELWEIPRQGSYRELSHKLWEFEKTYNDPLHLLIVYYAGHGAVDDDRNAIWKCYNSEDSPWVDWSSLQGHFLSDDTQADVLMLLDCCRAGSSVKAPKLASRGNIVYVLAASGFDNDSPLHGPHTFTANLIAELVRESTYSHGAKVTSVAGSVYNRLSKMNLPDGRKGVSAVHYPLRDLSFDDRTIVLMRQRTQACHVERLRDGEPSCPIGIPALGSKLHTAIAHNSPDQRHPISPPPVQLQIQDGCADQSMAGSSTEDGIPGSMSGDDDLSEVLPAEEIH